MRDAPDPSRAGFPALTAGRGISVTKRPRLAALLRAKAESSEFPAEAEMFHAKADELSIEHVYDKPFEAIPDAILYMISIFEAA